MSIKEIIDDERIDLAMQLDMLSETELNIIDFAFERIEDAVMKRIAELEAQVPSYGGAFERAVSKWHDVDDTPAACRLQDMLTAAHNADRAADKQRIADFDTALSASLAREKAYRETVVKQEQRIAELEKRLLIAEENQRFHRANIEKSADGSLNICWGEHEKWEDCEYVRYYPEQRIAESPPVAGSETEPEPDFTGRVAELEAALKLAMDWLDDDVPKYIVDELINSLR